MFVFIHHTIWIEAFSDTQQNTLNITQTTAFQKVGQQSFIRAGTTPRSNS